MEKENNSTWNDEPEEWYVTLKKILNFFMVPLLWIGIPVLIIMSMVAFPVVWIILLLLLLVLK